jgi:hypothetical protein
MATQLCEQCVQALGAFDYVAANKLAARVLKVSLACINESISSPTCTDFVATDSVGDYNTVW